MDGPAAILQLLVADTDVTTIVDPDVEPSRISGDILGQGVALPAIRVASISRRERNMPSPGVKRRVWERVQVDALGATRPEAKALMRAIRTACADKMPIISGISEVTVHLDGAGAEGTDLSTMARAETQDFMVSYNELR